MVIKLESGWYIEHKITEDKLSLVWLTKDQGFDWLFMNISSGKIINQNCTAPQEYKDLFYLYCKSL